MNAKTLILAILNAQDASGYEIKKLSSEGRFSYFVDISFGSIYPTLAKLEAEGLVTCRTEEHAGKPDRKVYSITPAGRLELAAGLAHLPQRDKFKSEFLLLAMNASIAGPQVVAQAVHQRMQWLGDEIEMLERAAQECSDPATSWVIAYGTSCMRNDLAHLKENAPDLLALAAGSQARMDAAE